MKAKNNGHPQRCVENLLATVRGEIPYNRIKGIDARIIDRPAGEARALMGQDAEYLLSTFEPRVTVEKITVTHNERGDFTVQAQTRARNG